MRKRRAATIFASLQAELKHDLTVFVLAAAALEVYKWGTPGIDVNKAGLFAVSAFFLALLYSALFHVFLPYTGKKAASIAVSVPGAFLTALLFNRFPDTVNTEEIKISYGMIAGAVYLIWLLLHLTQEISLIELIMCLLSDAVMIYAFFNGPGLFDGGRPGKAVYAVLFILSAANIRRVFQNKYEAEYPFALFALILLCLIFIPVREKPINWKPFAEAGRKIASGMEKISDNISYYLSDMGIGSSYLSGYSSYAKAGNAITLSQHTELEVKTRDNNVLIYTNEETGEKIKRRKVIYLTGGLKPDKDRFLDVLFSFYTHDVDTSDTYLFARMSDMDISYVYLKTHDEIMPEYTILAHNNDGRVIKGSSDKNHKKGYEIESQYLDLDTGSPYLIEIVSDPVSHIKKTDVSYKTMSVYAFELFGIRIADLINEEEYAYWQNNEESFDEFLETEGASERMKSLSLEITDGYGDDYEKCKAVEAYLRQYRYSTDVSSGEGAGIIDAKGMNKLSDEFLFENGKGYCVHFSSAMVMLLRLNGIPAREVTGYRYVFPFEKSDSYEVAGRYAHAWPEAYIQGFGWMSFEPTPAMTTSEERTWHRHPAASASGNNKEKAFAFGNDPYGNEGLVKPYPTPAVKIIRTEDGKEEGLWHLGEAVRLILIVISVALVMILLILLCTRLFRFLRYKFASSNKRLIMDVDDITTLIEGITRNPLERRGVLTDYIPYIPDELRDEADDVFKIYYRIKYRCKKDEDNREKVTEREEVCARDLRRKLKKELLSKRHKTRYALKNGQ